MTAGNDGRPAEEREERPQGWDDERAGERPDKDHGEQPDEHPVGRRGEDPEPHLDARSVGRSGEALDDEAALRRLMRDVVGDIEPDPRSLEHIRCAVPARRARRKQTLVAAAAAVLVIVTVPALMRAGVVPGPLGPDNRGSAAHSEQTGESGAQSGGEQSSGTGSADTGGKDATKGSGESAGGKDKDGDASASPSEGGSTESPGGSDGLPSTSPRCSRDQLGNGAAQVGAPNDRGHIYGSFRLANVSGSTCRVKGTDALVAAAQGKATSGTIQVLSHTEGDKADQLPSPSESSADLILRSGEAYQVRFAWIPDNERGPGGCTPSEPNPDPEPNDPGTDSGGSGGDTEGSTGDGNESNDVSTLGDSGTGTSGDSGDTGGGSATGVTLRYTPAAGEPQSSQAFLSDVCSGTIYRTGPLPAA